MWSLSRTYTAAALVVGLAYATLVAEAQAPGPLDAQRIGELAGTQATKTAEGVVRVTWPREDVAIQVDNTTLVPFAGLTSWAAFQPDPAGGAMVMGDLVLMQDEVNPVMDVLLDNGLAVTGLHNHFFFDQPRVFFMHIGGQGSVGQLAPAVRRALEKVRETRTATSQPPKTFGYERLAAASAVTAKPLEDIFGVKPDAKDGMVKFTFGRSTKMPCGCKVGSAMGVNTWAALIGTDDHALIDGDFACLPGELQPTLKALRKAGINIVAIHNHMEDESPRVMFLHYWGEGSAVELARGVRTALRAQDEVAALREKSGR